MRGVGSSPGVKESYINSFTCKKQSHLEKAVMGSVKAATNMHIFLLINIRMTLDPQDKQSNYQHLKIIVFLGKSGLLKEIQR